VHFSLVDRKKREKMAWGKKKRSIFDQKGKIIKGTFYGMGHLGLPCPFPPSTMISSSEI